MADITEKNPRGAGRKKKSWLRRTTQQTLTDTAPHCAKYLMDVVDKVVPPNWAIIDVCKYVINQVEGSPRQRHEHTGADGAPLITYPDLMLLAEVWEKEQLILIERAIIITEKEPALLEKGKESKAE